MFEMNELTNVFPGECPVMVMDDELMKVTDDYIHSRGYLSLRDVDTPAFMRNYYNESVKLPENRPISTQVPDPVVDLLRYLFRESENDFSFQTV